MSNLPVVEETIDKSKSRFLDMQSNLDWNEESLFAIQAATKSDFATQMALSNPVSLRMAVANVAAIGLTLNPARGLAYLVPRGKEIVLDISYRGLVHLAVKSGTIQWAKAEIVKENDDFSYEGIDKKPIHKFNWFSDRGRMFGVYCVAKLKDGTFLTEVMTKQQVEEVRASSKAKNGPWVKWYEEMAKKSVIKRASKSWPLVTPELNEAIRVLNEHEGLDQAEIAEGEITEGQAYKTEALSEEEVPDDGREMTEKVIERAANAGAWAAAHDYLTDRFKSDPQLRQWAIDRLNEAENKAAAA